MLTIATRTAIAVMYFINLAERLFAFILVCKRNHPMASVVEEVGSKM